VKRIDNATDGYNLVVSGAFGGSIGNDTIVFNLETGSIKHTLAAYNVPISPKVTVTELLPPEKGGNLANYLAAIRDLKHRVDYVKSARFMGIIENHPELMEASNYLNSILLKLDTTSVDSLKSYDNLDSLRPGKQVTLNLLSWSKNERDLLTDLFIDGKYFAGKRVSVPAGQNDFNFIIFDIPATIPTNKPAAIYLKLAPKSADWTQHTAEVSHITKTQPLNSINDYDKAKEIVSGAVSNFNLWYTVDSPATTSWDARIDIVDTNETWVAGTQYNLNGYGYAYIPLTIPGNLVTGKEYTVYYKLIPAGGQWDQFVDQAADKVIVK
jgi:hypothetical protein